MERSLIILLATLAAVQFTHIVDFMVLMPLGPQLMRDLGIGATEFGYLVSSYTFAAGLTGLIGSFFVDRFDRKRALFGLYLGFVLGTLACGLAQTFELLLAARFLTGAFGGMLGPVVLAIVGDAVPAAYRGRAMGMVMMSFSAATIFGVPLGLALANHWDWHAPFFFIVACAGFVIWGVRGYVPSMTSHMRSGKAPSVKDVVMGQRRWTGLLLMVFLVYGQFAIIPFISPYLVFNTGFSEKHLPWMYLLGGVISLITSPLWGRLCDRFGAVPINVVGVLASIVPFMLITHLPPTSELVALGATTLMFAVMGGRMVSAMTLVQGQVEPEIRGAYMGLVSSTQQFSSALAAFTSGHIVTKAADGSLLHYGTVGWLAAAFSILSVGVVVWAFPAVAGRGASRAK